MKQNLFGRVVSLLLALVLLCLPVAQVKAAEGFQYDPAAAIACAAANWDNQETLGTVCDQFVKNCLHAGGVTIRAGGVDEVKNALVDIGAGTLCQLNTTNDGSGYVLSSANPGVKAGDVIFYYCNDCGKSVHTAMIAGFDGNGAMQCYGHNPEWNLITWSANFTHTSDDGARHKDFLLYAVKMDTSLKDHKHDFGIKAPTDLSAKQVYEKAHPHRFYDQCSICDAKYYLGWNAKVSSCHICNPSPNGIPVLTATLVERNGAPAVALSWTAVEGVETYEIHRAKGNSSTYTKIGTTTSANFTNSSGEAGVTYRYKIVAGSVESNVVTITWPGTLAAPVLTGSITASGKAQLSWTDNTGANSYELYYKLSTDTDYEELKKTDGTPITSKTFSTSRVQSGKTYDFKVRAVYGDETYGDYSNVLSLTAPVLAPVMNDASFSDGKVNLSWSSLYGTVNYEIYYKQSTQTEFALLNSTVTVTGTSYKTSRIEAGKTYDYKVRSCYSDGTYSGFSNVVSMAVPSAEPEITYITFESADSFTLGTANSAKNWDGTLYYSTDATTWAEWSGTAAISSSSDGKLYLYGAGNTSMVLGGNPAASWVLTPATEGGTIACSGNIESLLDYATVAAGEHPTMATKAFAGLFRNCTSLTSAPDLLATTLTDGCYESMFMGCTSLVSAPALPATTLAAECYLNMFESCTSLVSAPALPATTLADHCYTQMFYFCTSLVNAPELPATTLAAGCYGNMFFNCTSLVSAPALPATTLAQECYMSMFQYCGNLAGAPDLPATTLAYWCYTNMFYGCKNLTSAPNLPATTLAEGCYYGMFTDCISLTRLPELPATKLEKDCYVSMFNGCTGITLYETGVGDTWSIPAGATEANNWNLRMFQGTGGTFTGDPEIGKVYYQQKETASGTVTRIFGADRYQTAFKAADTLKEVLGISKFENVIVSSGTNFADALAGSYLAAQKNAPILLVRASNVNAVKDYIKANLASGGTVYLLGGVNAVPKAMETGLDGFNVKRLGGATRYDTNLLILKEAGVGDKDIIVCTGKNFADSLSASATGLPILLVGAGLNQAQKDFLKGTSGRKVIVGGNNAVSTTVEKQLAAYGTVKRLAGSTRYETSILVAQEFFKNPTSAVLAYAQNFPDGLSGGPLAYAIGAPLILTATNREGVAVTYATGLGIKNGYVLGGTGLISDNVVKKIFSMGPTDTIH